MVFFTCNACGEALKKNQVEKHYLNRCRNCEVLTCVDCHKDFPGDSYQTHTKCISEDEKYGGKDYKPREGQNKGQRKQDSWIAALRDVATSRAGDISPEVKNLLDVVMQHENVPRKRQKFINFVKNIARRVRPDVIDETWDLFQEALKPAPTASNGAQSPTAPSSSDAAEVHDTKREEEGDLEAATADDNDDDEVEERLGVRMFRGSKKSKLADEANGLDISFNGDTTKGSVEKKAKKGKKKKRGATTEVETELMETTEQEAKPANKKKRKRKAAEDEEVEQVIAPLKQKKARKEEKENEGTAIGSTSSSSPEKFGWNGAVVSLLEKNDGEMKLNRLKKRVLAEYRTRSASSSHFSEAELSAKLDRKLKKNPRVVVLKERVKLKKSR